MSDPFVMFRMPPPATPPRPKCDWALFLDLDGTLLDIAPSPDRVRVPPDLVRDLAAASVALGGALAIVSGRMLKSVDALLTPLRLPGAGEHGAVIRRPDGGRDEIDVKVPDEWIDALTKAAARRAGVLIERKSHGVVAHYRRAAHFEEFLGQLCRDLVSERESEFEVLRSKLAFEIRPRAVTKEHAVRTLMEHEPFRGRRPVVVGDDVTDEDGFRAAAAFGGEGLNVFARFAGRPSEVRRWLKSVAAVQSPA
jgi:trehalose 6-phosphate phosphatase